MSSVLNALRQQQRRAANNPTLDQMQRQMSAMGCQKFEIQALPPKGSNERPDAIRKWTADGVVQAMGYLKKRNMEGYDIYIRPRCAQDGAAEPLIFVDDLNWDTVQKMGADGLPFTVLVESSPGNFHGWICVADYPLETKLATETAKLLAERYSGDPAAATWRHYGRLAGFTNQKPGRRLDNGYQPFAKLKIAQELDENGQRKVAAAGGMLLSEAQARMDWKEKLAQRAASFSLPSKDSSPSGNAAQAFLDAWHRATKDDASSRDFSASMSLLNQGYSIEETVQALKEASPNLEKRHRDSPNFQYAEHTVEKAAEYVRSSPKLSYR